MPEITESFLREQLHTRRHRLESALAGSPGAEGLAQLLKEVDSALARMEAGSYGICEECHDTIEKDRLLSDPLICYCLDHLTANERRALEQDLELAAQVQRGLLPRKSLQHDGWEVSYHYQPLGMVSGDYCEVVTSSNGAPGMFFALGDVSGKGVAASMLMSQLHAIFRTLVALDLSVPLLLERASRVFCESTMSSLFATLVCGRADAAGEIELSNAGHCPALLVHQERLTRLGATGVPLGLFCTGDYPSQRVQMEPGDTLFLFTDGVVESRSPSGAEYGEARLTQTLTRNGSRSPRELIHACLDDLSAFRSGTPLADDLTVMVVRRTR